MAPIPIAIVLPDLAAGGAQKVVLNFTQRLDRNMFTPHLIALDARGPWRSLVPPDLQVISLDRGRIRSALPALARKLRELQPRIIVSTMTYLNFGVLLLKPLLGGAPRFAVREANLPSTHGSSRFSRLAYRLGYRILYRWADAVICPAEIVAGELKADFGVPAARIVVIPNPVDESGLRAVAASPLRKAGPGRRFIAVGRLTRQKGYDRLLADFAQLPGDSALTIFGEGPSRPELAVQIERLGLGGRVSLAGFEPNPAAWIAGADALLLSSRWEGLPNVVLEALACGTPVIATPEAGGIAEIAAQAPSGAVKIASAGAEFAAAMLAIQPRTGAALRASLLPNDYRAASAAEAFAALLTGLAARPAPQPALS